MINRKLIAVLLIGITVFFGGCAATVAPEGGEPGGSILPFIIFMVVIFAILYFLMIRPQRKRQKEHSTIVQELKRGDRVITAGGIYGQIDIVDQESVILKVESGATIRMAKNSIAGRQEKI